MLLAPVLLACAASYAADCAGLPGVRCDADGTARLSSAGRSPSARSTEGLGSGILPLYDQPATLGAVTFQGDGTRCIGLLRRGTCR